MCIKAKQKEADRPVHGERHNYYDTAFIYHGGTIQPCGIGGQGEVSYP